MFNESYNDWNHKRGKAIIDYYGYKFFYGKKILDLGAGHGDIGAMFLRLGAEVTCVDAREDNLNEIRIKHPAIKTLRLDLEHEWPFARLQFDMVLSLGLLCHLKNYEDHIIRICDASEYIVLETEVLDIHDSNLRTAVYEERLINDLSFHGEGSIVSANNIQNRISAIGGFFKRFDNPKLNSGQYKYDWRESGHGRKFGNRRLWFIRRDKFISAKLDIQPKIQEAEQKLIAESAPNRAPPPPVPTHRATVSSALEKARNFQSVPMGPPEEPRQPLHMSVPSSSEEKIRLFFNYYEDKNLDRRREIDFCLEKNIDNKNFDLIIIQSDESPTFNFYFDKINRISGDNDINIICNSDIFFDNTIIMAGKLRSKEIYALTCWDWKNSSQSNHNAMGIQDVWIIRGKINNVDGNFIVGSPSSDKRIAYEFSKSGYSLLNPSLSIKAFHYHTNKNLNEFNIVPGPYLDVPSVGF